MNTKLIIGGGLAVVAVAMIGVQLLNTSEPDTTTGTYVDEDFVPTRPDVQARPNTFSVMTPEEKAAAEEAERIAAEQAALAASSTATTTATSTEIEVNTEADAS